LPPSISKELPLALGIILAFCFPRDTGYNENKPDLLKFQEMNASAANPCTTLPFVFPMLRFFFSHHRIAEITY
jgi:hypothetical protein